MRERDRSKIKCQCGAAFPWHLIDIGLTDHICSCERHWRLVGDKLELVGFKKNPFVNRSN